MPMNPYRRLAKGAALAIKSLSEEWYADCNMRKIDSLISRAMGWEFRIEKELEREVNDETSDTHSHT